MPAVVLVILAVFMTVFAAGILVAPTVFTALVMAAMAPVPVRGLGLVLAPSLAIRDAQRIRQVQGIGKALGGEKGAGQDGGGEQQQAMDGAGHGDLQGGGTASEPAPDAGIRILLHLALIPRQAAD